MVHPVHSTISQDSDSPTRNRVNTLVEPFNSTGVACRIPASLSLELYPRGGRQAANLWRAAGARRGVAGSFTLSRPRQFGEGLPMVILDAIAVGVPMEGADKARKPEVLNHGRTWLEVLPVDAVSSAAALGELMDEAYGWEAMPGAGHGKQHSQLPDRRMAEGVKEYGGGMNYV